VDNCEANLNKNFVFWTEIGKCAENLGEKCDILMQEWINMSEFKRKMDKCEGNLN
jgi:hypothetical protein